MSPADAPTNEELSADANAIKAAQHVIQDGNWLDYEVRAMASYVIEHSSRGARLSETESGGRLGIEPEASEPGRRPEVSPPDPAALLSEGLRKELRAAVNNLCTFLLYIDWTNDAYAAKARNLSDELDAAHNKVAALIERLEREIEGLIDKCAQIVNAARREGYVDLRTLVQRIRALKETP